MPYETKKYKESLLFFNEIIERVNTSKYTINTDFVKYKTNNTSESLLNNSNNKYNANSDEGKTSVLPMPKLKSLKGLNFKMNNFYQVKYLVFY